MTIGIVVYYSVERWRESTTHTVVVDGSVHDWLDAHCSGWHMAEVMVDGQSYLVFA